MALVLGDSSLRISLLGCLFLASIAYVIASAGQHKSLTAQLFGVAALSAACIPVLLAGSWSLPAALGLWSIWLVGFYAGTIGVKIVLAAQKQQSRGLHICLLGSLSAAVIISWILGAYASLVIVPQLLLSWSLALFPPRVRYLRRLGYQWPLVWW